ncbi:MAG: hypothetical protein ACYS3N_13710 [Planctomycetota bacterium]|jgi:hypothetical protein
MASSKNDIPKNQSIPDDVVGQADAPEDEIDLLDYFSVLWRRKYFIALVSSLPTLLLILILSLSPRSYKLTYLYDTGLMKRSYKTLLDRFYSAENLDMLTLRLKENKVDGRSQGMIAANVKFEVSPSYFEANAAQDADVENLPARGTLLTMTILDKSRKDIEKISSIIRDNFEKVLPIYDVKQELSTTTIDFKTKMADIEKDRFLLELELEKKRGVLAKLEDLESASSNKTASGIILQFDDVSENSQYLPLAYQMQVNISSIIHIEESIRADEKKYNYYKDLLSLNEELSDEVEDKRSSYYTIQQFHSFLTDMIVNYRDKQLIDYLNAYIKATENVISTNTPVVERPSIYPVPKGTVKKSAVSFVSFLMIALFAAFLLEAIQRKQAPTS